MTDPRISDKTLREAMATADALEEAFKSIAGSLAKVLQWKQRMFKVALACSIALVICLGLLGWAVWDNHRANQRVHAAVLLNSQVSQKLHAAELASCQERNRLQARNDAVWHRFIVLATAGRHQTSADQEVIRNLLAFADSAFTPVNCAKVYGP